MAKQKVVRKVKDPNSMNMQPIDYGKLLELVPSEAIQEAVKEQNAKEEKPKKPAVTRGKQIRSGWGSGGNVDGLLRQIKKQY